MVNKTLNNEIDEKTNEVRFINEEILRLMKEVNEMYVRFSFSMANCWCVPSIVTTRLQR